MNYPGSDKKFRVTCTQPDFEFSDGDFEITIKDQYGRVCQTVKKSDCFWDDQGRWYFVVENIRKGVYYAFFKGSYEDEDYDKQTRVFTDIQELYRVGYCGGCTCHCKHVVQYKEVWTVSIDGEDYLADCYGRYVLTSDGNRICFKNNKAQTIEDMGKVRMKMTGEQFLELMEERTPDGAINTIPELIDSMNGISDDTTVKEEIKDDTENTYDAENRRLYLNGSAPKPQPNTGE